MAVNHVVFQGRNVRDLELKSTQSGIEYVNFDVAWSDKYKENEIQCFLPCKAWRQTATFLDKYFHGKGAEMVLEGRLETEKWQDKDGNNRSRIVMNVDRVHFCGKKGDGAGQTAEAAVPANVPDGAKEVPDSDLPF